MGDLLGSLVWGAKSGQYCVIGGRSLHESCLKRRGRRDIIYFFFKIIISYENAAVLHSQKTEKYRELARLFFVTFLNFFLKFKEHDPFKETAVKALTHAKSAQDRWS
jgi:hypothetical protein